MSGASNGGLIPWLSDADCTLYHGDVLAVLPELPAESVDCVVTSPPYWGLRDYGTGGWDGGDPEHVHETLPARGGRGGSGSPGKQTDGAFPSEFAAATCSCGATRIDQQLGLESTPEQYVERMVEVFRELRRVLAPHGTVWLNLGDSYSSIGAKPGGDVGSYTDKKGEKRTYVRAPHKVTKGTQKSGWADAPRAKRDLGMVERDVELGAWALKPKDLVGIPWRVAFALQADGWYLRSDIIWAKLNPMPESVTDRPTKAHEYVFLLSKQPRYFFDQEAVREPAAWERWGDQTNPKHEGTNGAAGWIGSRSKNALQARSNKPGWSGNPNVHGEKGHPLPGAWTESGGGRNIRSVWEIATQPYPEAHFATFPEELARRCIAAGCPEQVCRVCGKARERVVESNSAANTRNERIADYDVPGLEKRTSHDRVRRLDGKNYEHVRQATGGFTVCAHSLTAENLRPGIVLDPFMGSGTVAHVARKLGRHAVGIDLSAEYLALAARRLQQQSLFSQGVA